MKNEEDNGDRQLCKQLELVAARWCKKNTSLTDRIISGCSATLFKSFLADISTRCVVICPIRFLTYLRTNFGISPEGTQSTL